MFMVRAVAVICVGAVVSWLAFCASSARLYNRAMFYE